MFKITNKRTGFFIYLDAHEVDVFFKRQDPYKYSVKEIRTIDYGDIKYAVIAAALMTLFMAGLIYFATNESERIFQENEKKEKIEWKEN